MQIKFNDENPGYRKFQGIWRQTHCEIDGGAAPADHPTLDATLTITDNRFSVQQPDGTLLIQGTFLIEVSKHPHWIDWTDNYGEDAGKTFPAIYRFEHDLFIFCATDPGRVRPTEFTTRPGEVKRVHKKISGLENAWGRRASG